MANIRKKFKGQTTYVSRFLVLPLNDICRWKLGRLSEEEVRLLVFVPPSRVQRLTRYVAKIVFTYILGYKVDVGHMEAVNLIASPKYSEKQIVSPLVHVARA